MFVLQATAFDDEIEETKVSEADGENTDDEMAFI